MTEQEVKDYGKRIWAFQAKGFTIKIHEHPGYDFRRTPSVSVSGRARIACPVFSNGWREAMRSPPSERESLLRQQDSPGLYISRNLEGIISDF
ncbi:hypothetical protein [Bradyrhizobium iriomotense]|uniref:hypothetical protein n=1 Tax=Bradyrhizobium iriomotense TaxID=441950 RepID=UPI0024E0F52C|nr:hypothetical protein [Bradyrhizobium iriomotense]